MDEHTRAPRTTPQVNVHQMAVAPRATKENPTRPLPLLFWLIFAATLYASWAFFQPTHLWWSDVDASVFLKLNAFAASSHSTQIFWAVLSSRLFDIVPAIIFLCVFWSYLKGDGGLFFRRRSAEISVVVGYMLLTVIVGKLLFNFPHPSPSLVLVPNYRLSELVPWAFVKDFAPASFPSDHALLYIMISGLLWHFTSKARGMIIGALGLLMMLPRMASGAHWCTDIFVGALALGVAMLAFACFTPLGSFLVKLAERILGLPPLNGLLARFESVIVRN